MPIEPLSALVAFISEIQVVKAQSTCLDLFELILGHGYLLNSTAVAGRDELEHISAIGQFDRPAGPSHECLTDGWFLGSWNNLFAELDQDDLHEKLAEGNCSKRCCFEVYYGFGDSTRCVAAWNPLGVCTGFIVRGLPKGSSLWSVPEMRSWRHAVEGPSREPSDT